MGLQSGTEALKKAFLKCSALGLAKSCSGSIAIPLAITAPMLLAAVGAASDMAVFSMKRSELQAAADNAAIAAANELALGKTSDSVLESAAHAFVDAAIHDPKRNVAVDVNLNDDDSSVTVQVREDWTPFFAHFVGVDVTPIVMKATATLAGSSNICVLTLHPSTSQSLRLQSGATVKAKGCSIIVDSTSATSAVIGNKAAVTSSQLCTAGGVKNDGLADAAPTTDCPVIADPLGARAEPKITGCDFNNTNISSGNVVLQPGTYCGGIRISGTANVVFQTGNYAIKDGPFRISANSKAKGDNVGFYLAGNLTTLQFSGNADINFSGSLKDEMAGLLFFESRNASKGRNHRIGSRNAHTLTGTIYMPRGNLLIDPGANVAAGSAYTVIIAQNLRLDKGPELTLNTNYDETNVPIPAGIRSSSQIVLTE
jgi:Flp pilus assembly protein TadG